jgi:Haem-degrading
MRRSADGPLLLEAGGQLIRDVTGEIVGALGVTGDVNDVDDICAIDGIHAGGFRADGNFDPKAARRLNIKRDPSLRDPARGRQGTRAASHLPWEGPTLTPALAGADFP